MELCVLLKTTDIAQLTVIKSVLDFAGIEYLVQGEEGLRQIPVSWPGGFFGPAAHGAVIRVRREDFEAARSLLDQRVGEWDEGLELEDTHE